MTAHKTTDREPVFPCWLWPGAANFAKPMWVHRADFAPDPIPPWYTHWHPDQPAAPTETPGEPQGPTCDRCKAPLNEGEAKCFTVCDACWDATKAQPTPEAVPMWVKEAAIELHSEAWHGLTYNAMIELTAKAIARHAPPPVGEVTDSEMLDWLDTQPYHHLSLVRNIMPLTPINRSAIRSAILAAMRSGREGEKS